MRKLFVALIAITLLCFIVPRSHAAGAPQHDISGTCATDAAHVTASTPVDILWCGAPRGVVAPNYAQILAIDSFRVNFADATANGLNFDYRDDANVNARKNARGSATAATQRTRAVRS